MSYFNTRAVPLFPSYALTPKKEKELDELCSNPGWRAVW